VPFSVGILYSSQSFLGSVRDGKLDLANFSESFSRIEVAEASQVLAMAQNCRWVRITGDGVIELTERGITLAAIGEEAGCLREQLLDLLSAEAPPWSKKIIQGRYEAFQSMPEAERQCFTECGLFRDTEEPTVAWWDRAQDLVRSVRSKVNLAVGREAERRSLRFEQKRTGIAAKWQAIETNLAGYDVLSVVDSAAQRSLKIEVKGSGLPRSHAPFFLTRNEWNTATTSDDFCFHLWLIHEKPTLFVVPAKEMVSHVPADGSTGRWESAQLFFKDFVSYEQNLSA
jgi:hypothetical protein